MRRSRFLVLVICLIAVAGVAVFFLLRRGRLSELLGHGGRPTSRGALSALLEEEGNIEPLPDISLQINNQDELKLFRGTPLILSVRLGNQRAMSAAARNEANRYKIEALQQSVARNQIPKEKADAQIAILRQTLEIPTVRLGDVGTNWSQFVRFVVVPANSQQQLPAWPIRLATLPQDNVATLDAENTYQLDYVLEPKAAADLQVGEYRVTATIEVSSSTNLPADRWRGRADSEPVTLGITEKPAQLSKPEQEQFHLAFARYFSLVGQLRDALDSAQKALAANPHSISAHILIGETKERLGDLAGALAAFDTAEGEYYRQHPDSYEAPLYLIRKRIELARKLNLVSGQAAPKPPGR